MQRPARAELSQAVSVTVVGAIDRYLDLLDKVIDQARRTLQGRQQPIDSEVLSKQAMRRPGVPHVRALTSAVLKLLLAMVESGASTITPPAISEIAKLVSKEGRYARAHRIAAFQP